MSLLPLSGIYVAGGWIMISLYIIILALLMATTPKDVLARLYAHERTGRRHDAAETLCKGAFLVNALIICLARLAPDSHMFVIGIAAFASGEIAFIMAVIDYRYSPVDRPATRGLYKFSRNPQIVANLVSLGGICCTVNALLPFVVLAFEAVCMHLKVLEEEKVCLRRYGKEYLLYMERTSRYLPTVSFLMRARS